MISAEGLKGMGGEASLWKLPGLAQTPAGRHQQVLWSMICALLGFGPRTPQALLQLRQKSGAATLMFATVSRQLWLMAIVLLGLTLFATTLGAMRLPLANLWGSGDEVLRHIWLTIRLPRVLLALLVGSALALSGCVMQGLFRNPLAAIRPVGISSGAALAVAFWLVLPISVPAIVALYAPMLAAFIGSLAVMVVIFVLQQVGGQFALPPAAGGYCN
ncbi:Hemin-binding periplasmic protein hmuT precursor [Kluyvera cryocrescens]|uniref:Hemin-binding periplasmic protein hmuT n=1 Tax=Kluyvera cryocrescens TaxID=580 RepID=A0A485B4F8_KLUCR|nr:Hemin-binding periplasmic protein hmuT precursor [Kluyvera cryocrescens]